MSSGAYDDLFVMRSKPGRSWYNTLTVEAQDWVDGLVAAIIDRGVEPGVWADVNDAFAEKFPAQLPRSKTTIATNVRQLVQERG